MLSHSGSNSPNLSIALKICPLLFPFSGGRTSRENPAPPWFLINSGIVILDYLVRQKYEKSRAIQNKNTQNRKTKTAKPFSKSKLTYRCIEPLIQKSLYQFCIMAFVSLYQPIVEHNSNYLSNCLKRFSI